MGFEPTTFCMASDALLSGLELVQAVAVLARARRSHTNSGRAPATSGASGAAFRALKGTVRGDLPARCAPGAPRGRSRGRSPASRAASTESSRSASFLTRYSPVICFTSSSESEITSTSSTASSSAFSRPAIRALYSATLFVATPIFSPCAASTVPSLDSSTYPYAAGPGLPRAPPSVDRRAFTRRCCMSGFSSNAAPRRDARRAARARSRPPAQRHDGLDPQLGDAFLLPHPADRRVRALAGEERPGAGRVPRAAR